VLQYGGSLFVAWGGISTNTVVSTITLTLYSIYGRYEAGC